MRKRKVRGCGDENVQGNVRMKKLVWSRFFFQLWVYGPQLRKRRARTYLSQETRYALFTRENCDVCTPFLTGRENGL